MSLGRLRGIPTAKFLYVMFRYRFFLSILLGDNLHGATGSRGQVLRQLVACPLVERRGRATTGTQEQFPSLSCCPSFSVVHVMGCGLLDARHGSSELSLQFFFRRFFAFPGKYSTSEAQIFAENRRKPQIFAETADFRRKPQIFAEIRLSHLVCPFNSSLKLPVQLRPATDLKSQRFEPLSFLPSFLSRQAM